MDSMSFETNEFYENAMHVSDRRRNKLLFPDRSFSINFDSWCNNSIQTVLNYIKLPSNILLPPPSYNLDRCYGTICFDPQKNPMSVLTINEYVKPKTFQNFIYNKDQNTWEITDATIQFVNKIENTIFKYDSTDNRLTISGSRVQMSNVVKHKDWNDAVFIDIFAIDEIVFDANIDKSGKSARITILAPNWNVPSGAEIILDGKKAEDYSKPADNGIGVGVKGHNGKVGKPGGSAGHFYGAGVSFKNIKHLSISANGGKGGTGQTGGNGKILKIIPFYIYEIILYLRPKNTNPLHICRFTRGQWRRCSIAQGCIRRSITKNR